MRRMLAYVWAAGLAALVWGVGVAAARTVVIGHSVRGRAITAIVRGPDDARRKILVVGCIHGNECEGLRITSALARSKPVKGVQLWIVPEMNPDGTAADIRQNAHGVDLNRNFPYQWQRVTNPVYYAGPRPLSEPETRAAVKLVRRIKPAVTIWYHQHEDLVDMAGGDRGVARRYARLAHLRATCLPFLPGTATGWSKPRVPGHHGVCGRAAGRPCGGRCFGGAPAGGPCDGAGTAGRLAEQLRGVGCRAGGRAVWGSAGARGAAARGRPPTTSRSTTSPQPAGCSPR